MTQVVRRKRFGSRWMAVGAVSFLLVLCIGSLMLGATAADRAVHDADVTLKTTIDHQQSVTATLTAEPLKNIDFRSGNTKVAAAKSALATFEPQMARARALVKSDRGRLVAARQSLAGSVFTLPERAVLDQRRRRVAAALTALDNAQRALDLDQKMAEFAHPLFDALAALEALEGSVKANNTAAMVGQLQAAQDGLNKAQELAKPPAIPPQLERLLTSINFLISDMQGLLSAAQAHDAAGVQHFLQAADGALNGLAEYDPQTVDTYLTKLFGPLTDAYRINMRVAAGG